MSFECECNKCKEDIIQRGDVYCDKCYKELEDIIESQRAEIDEQGDRINSLEEQIEALELEKSDI